MFGSNLKWVKKQSSNFPYFASYVIELFSKKKKKNSEEQSLKIIHCFFYWLKIVFLRPIFFYA